MTDRENHINRNEEFLSRTTKDSELEKQPEFFLLVDFLNVAVEHGAHLAVSPHDRVVVISYAQTDKSCEDLRPLCKRTKYKMKEGHVSRQGVHCKIRSGLTKMHQALPEIVREQFPLNELLYLKRKTPKKFGQLSKLTQEINLAPSN